MPINLNVLIPEFKAKVEQLLLNCKNAGYEMQPNNAVRTAIEQGKLWRQSRTAAEVAAEITSLKNQGAGFLASCIDAAGPQNGEHVTNAIPGLSWHQWGEALDCVWIVNGVENWSTDFLVNGKNGYAVYASLAKEIGLTPGGLWPHFKDWPHVQLRSADSPLYIMSITDIDTAMKEKFGDA